MNLLRGVFSTQAAALNSAPERIAIFGGSFDPPHNGHLLLAEELLSEIDFSKIVIVPSKYPPDKTPAASYEDRLRWCHAIFSDSRFEVSSFENVFSQTVFGRDIFYHFWVKYPQAEFSWILGEDQWQRLSYWKEADEYACRLEWIVLPRPTAQNAPSHRPRTGLMSRRLLRSSCRYRRSTIHARPEISSTQIREKIQNLTDASEIRAVSEVSWIPESIREEVLKVYLGSLKTKPVMEKEEIN